MLITSLLDQDLYKFTMAQVAFHQFPDTHVTYGFKCRTEGVDFTTLEDEIREQIMALGDLRFLSYELDHLRTLPFLKNDFIDSLRDFSLNPEEQVSCYCTPDGELHIEIEGKWTDTIWYEIPILAIVNELYFDYTTDLEYAEFVGMHNLHTKIGTAQRNPQIKFADFGTRRRFSQEWQDKVISILATQNIGFTGTSNVELAMRYDLKPIGTMAHEFLQAAQVLAPSVEETQKFALECWLKEYKGQLGIALTDIFGVDVFLKDFSKDLAEQYAGVRHDSGSPRDFMEKVIGHYLKLGINPADKTIVFSDGLTFDSMVELTQAANSCLYGRKHGADPINVAFGIGTNLTNDCGYKPLSIVMKMITCNGKPTVKLSDSPGKVMCRDENYIKQVQQMINKKLAESER